MTVPVARPRGRPVAVLMILGAVAYANTFSGVFQFDDVASILRDPRLGDPGTFLTHLAGTIRPFLKLTFFADRQLWGESPAGYHLLNLLLHLGSGLLIYAILARLVNEAAPRPAADSAASVPFWAALLFLVHPVGTETVTYLSGRATGLMAFFYLAGFHLYLRASSAVTASRLSGAYAGAIACFVLALLSKETAVTLPAALLLAELVIRARRGDALRAVFLRLHSPFWAVLLLFLAAAAIHPRYAYLFDFSLGLRPLHENLLTQVNVVAYALVLFFAPARLNFEHDLPSYGAVVAWPTPAALALLLGLVALAVVRARKNPLPAFGILWFFLQLLPANSVLPRYDLLSERNLYLPAAGLCLALVSLWFAFTGRLRESFEDRRAIFAAKALGFLPLAVVPLLITATLARNALYADPIVFWSDAVAKSPEKARPRVNLGHAYYLAGDVERAIEQFRIALTLDRDNPVAQANMRAAWALKSRPETGSTHDDEFAVVE